MSENQKASSERILYRVDEISTDLETMSIQEHITVCNMLTQLLQFRVGEEQAKAQREADDLKKKLERENKFGLRPGQPQ